MNATSHLTWTGQSITEGVSTNGNLRSDSRGILAPPRPGRREHVYFFSLSVSIISCHDLIDLNNFINSIHLLKALLSPSPPQSWRPHVRPSPPSPSHAVADHARLVEQIRTTTTELLKIKHPIMLAGMNVAAGPKLAAAVTNAGGIGVIGGVGYTPDMLREQIAELKGFLQDKNAPFGVDLLIPQVGGSARKTKYV